jgi:hypothetical protein
MLCCAESYVLRVAPKSADTTERFSRSDTTTGASVLLAGQLIATKLNLANHSNSAPVSSTIKDASTLREYNHGELNDNCIP